MTDTPEGQETKVFIRAKGVCERCGISLEGITPDIHHKNRNTEDNRLQNLILLCPNCHSQMHYNKDGSKKKKDLNY